MIWAPVSLPLIRPLMSSASGALDSAHPAPGPPGAGAIHEVLMVVRGRSSDRLRFQACSRTLLSGASDHLSSSESVHFSVPVALPPQSDS
jgi:hypothetical protein